MFFSANNLSYRKNILYAVLIATVQSASTTAYTVEHIVQYSSVQTGLQKCGSSLR